MSYIVFARKYRPQTFDEIIGQSPITTTLKNAVSQNRVAHAYIFTGPRGVGKTTTARILAKALNCEKGSPPEPCNSCASCNEITKGSSLDIMEIDGASNRGIDEIRNLRESVKFAPSNARFKIYIIDEVHMLTNEAFNALLKTLEEPPPAVIFVFATTEPQKIPDTILSRCQRFDFRQISDDQIAAHLKKVVKAEKIGISDTGLALISRQADGSLRDALSLLDQVVAFTGEKVPDEEIVSVLGLTDRALIVRTLEALIRHDSKEALAVLRDVLEKGFDPKTYLLELWERVRDLLVLKSGAPEELVRATPDELHRMKEWLGELQEEEVERWFDLLRGVLNEVGRSEFPRFLMEVTFLKMTRSETRLPLTQLVDRLELLESKLAARPLSAPAVASPRVAPSAQPKDEPTPAPRSGVPGDWDKVLETVKRQKPPFAAVLLQAAQIEVKEGKIVLTFDEGSFHLARAKETDFQSYLNRIASEILAAPHAVEIRTQTRSSAPAASNASLDRAREREALENPAVQRAVSIFSAKIEEVKPIK